jgi:hypothetical protein
MKLNRNVVWHVYKWFETWQQEMEIDTALSEIESKYDFTFKGKQLTAIKSIIENKDTIDLFVYKHFLSSPQKHSI